MANCPNCRKHFKEPVDEEGEHDCPYCGYSHEDALQDSLKEEYGEEPLEALEMAILKVKRIARKGIKQGGIMSTNDCVKLRRTAEDLEEISKWVEDEI